MVAIRIVPLMSVTFSDLKAMLAAKQFPAQTTPPACETVLAGLHEQGIALTGEWIDAVQQIARLQQKPWPILKHPCVALYAAGYADQATEKTALRLQKLSRQDDPMTRLCTQVNADLRVYELDLSRNVPSQGLSEEDAAHAMSYGLMSVEEHVDCLVPEVISPGADQVLTEWHSALLREDALDPLEALRNAKAGADLFALMGGVLAAWMAGIPVFCGSQLASVLPLALARLLPEGHSTFCISLPSAIVASDAVQAVSGLKQLQLILALGPEPAPALKTVQLT